MPASNASPDASAGLTGRIVLGRYRIVRPLARGGMGVVYLGRVEGAAGFSKPVVVKSVLTSFGREDEAERLFAREARIVSNLNHPGVVAVIDFGRVGDAAVMVLEYVHGYHLLQWLRFVTETRRASISAVQRQLRVGYNRAARMIEAMEQAGVVGPAENGKRAVLAPPPPE